ncbi:MAG: endo-1,4-beta-xylanase [Armatimonadota bacterium]|nr:endo-1,4-beta-xylanase [Armatimonadota bacterium]
MKSLVFLLLMCFLAAPLPAGEAPQMRPFALEGIAFKEDNGARVLKDGDALELTGAKDSGSGSQATTGIAARSRLTFRAVATLDPRHRYNYFSLIVGGSTGRYVSGGVASGAFKGSLTQHENARVKAAQEEKEGAPAPNDKPIALELNVDTIAKTVVFTAGDWQIASELKVDLGRIDKIGFGTYRTGATFRDIQISEVPGADLGVPELGVTTGAAGPPPTPRATPRDALGDYEKALVTGELNNLPPGNFMLATEQNAALKAFSPRSQAQVAIVDVAGQPFQRAIQIVAPDGVKKDNDAMVTAFNTQPIRKGDMIFFTFWHRVLASRDETRLGKGRLWFVPRNWSGPFMLAKDFTPASEWRQVRAATRANQDFAPGEAEMQLHFGYYPQTVEIGGFTAINFGSAVAPDDTPRERLSIVDYEGRAPDAAWRREAAARIENFRKADLKIAVVGVDGRPIPGAQVAARMKRHAFRWGTTTDVFPLLGVTGRHGNRQYTPEMVARHNEFLKSTFNYIALENSLKEVPWRDEYGRFKREWVMQALQWLQDNGFEIKGHVMHWGFRKELLPDKFRPLADVRPPAPELRQYAIDHIRDIGGATKDIVRTWDVINEHKGFHLSTDLFDKDYAVELFHEAKQATNGARLFWTESETADPEHLEWARYLKAKGAPLDGLGYQGHFDVSAFPGPEQIWKYLDRANDLNLDLEFTEVDVGVKAPQDKRQLQLRLDFLRDFMTAIFAHPRCSGLLFWTTIPGDWKPETALLDEQTRLRPQGQVVQDFITRTFWTNTDGATDQQGHMTTRGFLGDYEVTVTTNGKTKTVQTVLPRVGQTVRVKLE